MTTNYSNDHKIDRLTSVVLDGYNYLHWSRGITIALQAKEKVGHIDGSIKAKETTVEGYAKWRADDSQVITWILNSLNSDIYSVFCYANTAKELWENLKSMYSHETNLRRIFELQQKLTTIKMKDDQSFAQHLGLIKKLRQELKVYRPQTTDVKTIAERET